jgi:hypothetical protein
MTTCRAWMTTMCAADGRPRICDFQYVSLWPLALR